jgi:hypothetical protein
MADINQLLDGKRAFANTDVGGRVTHAVINDVSDAAARAGTRRLSAW